MKIPDSAGPQFSEDYLSRTKFPYVYQCFVTVDTAVFGTYDRTLVFDFGTVTKLGTRLVVDSELDFSPSVVKSVSVNEQYGTRQMNPLFLWEPPNTLKARAADNGTLKASLGSSQKVPTEVLNVFRLSIAGDLSESHL